ncbi:MAG: phytoene/squalene synthase family protein [Bacteriovoracia bacterium]
MKDNFNYVDKTIIKNGSKSFSIASSFFPKDIKIAAHQLYSWCRYCDDQIDEAKYPEENLKEIHKKTVAAYNRSTNGLESVFCSLEVLLENYKIPIQYPLDLLEGFKLDCEKRTYKSAEDLRIYCYHVAGTVGLMMTHICGASSMNALNHAIEMGIAMQLTNIARDVKEDIERGRVYLPTENLSREGLSNFLSIEDIMDPEKRKKIYQVVCDVLKSAEASYQKGFEGLIYLPIYAILAVASAAEIYRAIGLKILSKGPDSLLDRTVISNTAKVLCIFKALRRIPQLYFKRIFRKWQPIPLPTTWLFTNANPRSDE